jgi:DNA methylase/NACHT-associated inactive Restriction Endonuclease 1
MRLGYPTQKPVSLLERIMLSSSNEGDVVLDPFCGCGTAVDAAQKLGRRWVGIDITTLAIDLIDARLRTTYGEQIRDTYEMLGIPKDLLGAAALFKRSPFEFERWCVMLVEGQPNEKQVGDRGIDGVIRFPLGGKGNSGRTLVSVKGGATNPGHVRDLIGTVTSQRAELGVFVCMNPPTKGMIEAADHSGSWDHPANGQRFPVVQILTVEELLNGKRPQHATGAHPLLPGREAPSRGPDAPAVLTRVAFHRRVRTSRPLCATSPRESPVITGRQAAYMRSPLTHIGAGQGGFSRGRPCRARTDDQRIKSPMLYQLS